MRKTVLTLAIAASLVISVTLKNSPVVKAENTVTVVSEYDITRQTENTAPTDNWVLYTRAGTPGTAGSFVAGPTNPPGGVGSLRLVTNTSSEKVFLFNYDHFSKPISTVTEIGYWTYRNAGSLQQVTALNMQIDYNGLETTGGFATLVFEPVYNVAQGAVVSENWQEWDAFNGIWWSTQPINGMCAGANAACDKTWAEIVANNPDAVILAFGVNQGSGNPSLSASVDLLTIGFATGGFAYDFEPDSDGDGVLDADDNCPLKPNADQADGDNDGMGDVCDDDAIEPTTVNQCKNYGWQTFYLPRVFNNQGDCIQFVLTGR